MDYQPSPTSFLTLKTPAQTILAAGLLAGSIDLAAAVISSGVPVEKVLPFIASSVFGKAAFAGGWTMLAWGLAFHFFIAFFWTMLFFGFYPKVKGVSKNLVITGLVYGVVIWLVMNLLVLPLANAPKQPFDWLSAAKGMLILIFMVGLPIALIIGQYYRNVRSA